MSTLSRSRFVPLLVLTAISLACGCSSETGSPTTVVVVSDVHFNPFYDPKNLTMFQSLVTADPSEWAGIFETSSVTGPSTWGDDTNYPLFIQALSNMKQRLGTSPLVIFTGDFLGHNFASLFYDEYYGSTTHPDPDAAAVAAMQTFTYKTVAFFVAQVRSHLGKVPVMFVLGNNDSYEGDYLLAPNSTFLSDTAGLFYTDLLMGTADAQAFLQTYQAGGYYAAQPIGTKLAVIALNTVFMTAKASAVAGIDSAVQAELNWLESTLASVKASGKKVWLLMHVPPGADEIKTGGSLDGGSEIATAAMMMQANYQASLLQILSNYAGIIPLSLAGHTHMDEYRNILGDTSSASEILEITPSISPRDGNNPAFKVITYSGSTFEPVDYVSYNYDLATPTGQFNSYYTFSNAYSMPGLMDPAMTELVPELAANNAKQTFYRGSFYSGHNSSNSITNANWPVYWCGVGKMVQQNVVDCVNAYKN